MSDLAPLERAAIPRDLLDFAGSALYFDEPPPHAVARLLDAAADTADRAERRTLLRQADRLAPDDLTVIVALYRFHYFAHDFEPCLRMADRAMAAAARRLNLPADWRHLTAADIDRVGSTAMPMLRFYLWALKGRGYLLLRLGCYASAIAPLETLVGLDAADRLGARALLALARERLSPDEIERSPEP